MQVYYIHNRWKKQLFFRVFYCYSWFFGGVIFSDFLSDLFLFFFPESFYFSVFQSYVLFWWFESMSQKHELP